MRYLPILILIAACDSGGSIIVPDPWRPLGDYTLTTTAEIQWEGGTLTPNIVSRVHFTPEGSGVRFEAENTGFLPASKLLRAEGDAWVLDFETNVVPGGPTALSIRFTEAEPPHCVASSQWQSDGPCGLVR